MGECSKNLVARTVCMQEAIKLLYLLALHVDFSLVTSAVSIGRNQPLKPEKPKWKSDVPLTEGQLRSKRDEFWDTAPAFEGRKEIWDALKGAAYALETGDHQLAQAIIDGASISLPNGEAHGGGGNSVNL